jgi:hypothetical protein
MQPVITGQRRSTHLSRRSPDSDFLNATCGINKKNSTHEAQSMDDGPSYAARIGTNTHSNHSSSENNSNIIDDEVQPALNTWSRNGTFLRALL